MWWKNIYQKIGSPSLEQMTQDQMLKKTTALHQYHQVAEVAVRLVLSA